MSNEYCTVEDGKEILRKDKGNPGTMGGIFYALAGNSAPEVLERLEEHFATMVAAGQNVIIEMQKADKNPEKRRAFMKELINISNKKKSIFEMEI